jgi:FkbM family methyltransferase
MIVIMDEPNDIRVVKDKRVVKIAWRHRIYVRDIVMNFDYYFGASEWSWDGEGSDLRVVDYSKPCEHFVRSLGVPFMFTSFPETGETIELYLKKAELHTGCVVLDLGAYCGASTWAFSAACGKDGRVYSFEPDAENFDALGYNIKKHSLENVKAFRKALWSSCGRMKFQGEANMGSGLVSVLIRDSSTYLVDVTTLDEIVKENNIERVDFVKMDIEGSEVEVLKSAGEFLRRFKPKLLIEPHILNGCLSDAAIKAILTGYGYSYEEVKQPDGFPLIFAKSDWRPTRPALNYGLNYGAT